MTEKETAILCECSADIVYMVVIMCSAIFLYNVWVLLFLLPLNTTYITKTIFNKEERK